VRWGGKPSYTIAVIEDITERKRVEEAQRFLVEAGMALSSSLDHRATLASVARLAVPYLADWCVVDVLKEDDSLDRVAVAHQDPEKVAWAYELQERYPPDVDSSYGVGRALRTGRPELVAEISKPLLEEAARDAEHREILQNLGIESYLIVPLVARGRTLGAITLVSAESGWRYGPADLELAEELARRAALAVDNARLYRERSETAHALQGSLLPSGFPDVPGIEVGLRYLPAGEADVGGDFYDVFDTSVRCRKGSPEPPDSSGSSSWGVVIGDVCGKGAEGRGGLALARYTIRAVAMHEKCPTAILAGLNEAMLRQRREHDDHKFCTVAYARLEANDAERGAKVYLSLGGHPGSRLARSGGNTRRVGEPGRALGVFDDPGLTPQETSLAPATPSCSTPTVLPRLALRAAPSSVKSVSCPFCAPAPAAMLRAWPLAWRAPFWTSRRTPPATIWPSWYCEYRVVKPWSSVSSWRSTSLTADQTSEAVWLDRLSLRSHVLLDTLADAVNDEFFSASLRRGGRWLQCCCDELYRPDNLGRRASRRRPATIGSGRSPRRSSSRRGRGRYRALDRGELGGQAAPATSRIISASVKKPANAMRMPRKGLREEQRGRRGREEHRPDGERRDLGAPVQEVGDG
jgi:hypothetical protein